MNNNENKIKLYKDDFINEMLNQSDYKESEIIKFANNYFDNLYSFEYNVNLFISLIQ